MDHKSVAVEVRVVAAVENNVRSVSVMHKINVCKLYLNLILTTAESLVRPNLPKPQAR